MPQKPGHIALRYVTLCVRRQKGDEEKEIAQDLVGDTPRYLYRVLARDGYPVCTVCGETPAPPDHCKTTSEPKRKARRSTQENRLPPPKSAEWSFRLALAWLEEDVKLLPLLEERLQGERFVATLTEPEGEFILSHRMFYEPDWERLCEIYGIDPDVYTQIDVKGEGTTRPYGANPNPPRPLVRLIAAYALSYGTLDPLLDTLHPDPASADENKLSEKLDLFKLVVGQIATLVREGKVRPGPSTGAVSMEEQRIAWAISRRRKEGASDETILREIRHLGHDAFGRPLTRGDVLRLGGLRLEAPPD